MAAPNPDNIPQPQGRPGPRVNGTFVPGSFLVNNQAQMETTAFADPPEALTTELQPDVSHGETFTPAQPGDKGEYNGRWPSPLDPGR